MHATAFAWLLAGLALLSGGAAPRQSKPMENSPAAVAKAFIEARLAQDRESALPLLTSKAREAYSKAEMAGMAGGECSIGHVSHQGDTAEVAATLLKEGRSEELTVLTKTEDGAWRVYGMRKGPLTIDFEALESEMQAFAESFGEHLRKAHQERFSNPAEDPSSLHLKEAFLKRHKNQDDLSAMTALEALMHLSKGMGLRLEAGIYADELRTAAPVDVKGLQRLEAIERIARRFGLHPVYPSPESVAKLAQSESSTEAKKETLQQPGSGIVTISWPENPSQGAITFQRGQRPYPVAFAGPFLISLEKVEEHVPYATARMHLAVRAYGLAPLVSQLFSQLKESLEIYSVEDARGGSLLKSPEMGYAGWQSPLGAAAYRNDFEIDLVRLLRDVEGIALIKGGQPLLLPVEIVPLAFSDLKAGDVQRSGELSVAVTSHSQETAFDIKGSAESLKNLFVDFEARDSQGQRLAIEDRRQIRQQESLLEARLTASAVPSSVVLKLVRTAIVKFPFELREVALKRHSDMPRELAPLSFQGPVPVRVEFVRFTGKDSQHALLRLHNRSSKDVLSIRVERIALSSQGAELGRRTETLEPTRPGGAEWLVGAGAKEEREEWVPFLPRGSAQLQFQVESVEFMDGTRWNRP